MCEKFVGHVVAWPAFPLDEPYISISACVASFKPLVLSQPSIAKVGRIVCSYICNCQCANDSSLLTAAWKTRGHHMLCAQ